jgi:glucoamylase
VTLTGQDGFSSDQARAFTSTPGAYSFGVCAVASTDPHCTFNPNSVPKVMDSLTPLGTTQSNELDYTLHTPVVLQPVLMP